MSDRRPEPKVLYVQRPVPGGVWDFQPADDLELVAAVRRGVESGTIEGEVREAIDGCIHVDGVPDGEFLIVHIGPVSDGGSET